MIRARRPRRRGDWSRQLPSFSVLDAPLPADPDSFPCDSSCSGESFSSQDYYLADQHRRRIRPSPSSDLHTLLERPRSLSTPRPSSKSLYPPQKLPPRIRDLTLSEYTAAELPDIGMFLNGVLPMFGRQAALPSSPTRAAAAAAAAQRRAHVRRSSSSPPRLLKPSLYAKPPKNTDKVTKRPPVIPEAGNPSQGANKRSCKESSPRSPKDNGRRDAMKRSRSTGSSSSRRRKLSPKIGTRRYSADIAFSRELQYKDPDSWHTSFLADKLNGLMLSIFGLTEGDNSRGR